MSRISGDRHPQYMNMERVGWRMEHADLIEWLSGEGMNLTGFVADMRRDLLFYGWLTDAQTAVVERIREQGLARPSTSPQVTPGATATEDDLLSIFNGVYTINDGTEHLTYRIHTVQRGPLQGKRIIKIQQQYGEFKGFGFLTTDGRIKVWRSFLDAERRNEKFVVWASVLMQILAAANDQYDNPSWERIEMDVQGTDYEVQLARTCRRCNRTLTAPSSIDAGLGSECAQRVNERTTAAARHEVIGAVTNDAQPGEPVEVNLSVSDAFTTLEDSVRVATETAREAFADTTTPAHPAGYPTEAQLVLARERDYQAQERGETSGEFMALLRVMTYHDRSRCCRDCGRLFVSNRGVARHRNSCPQRNRSYNISVRLAATQGTPVTAAYRQPARPVRRGPSTRTRTGANPSALGTRIDGSVWDQ